jgi:hypothetical protein
MPPLRGWIRALDFSRPSRSLLAFLFLLEGFLLLGQQLLVVRNSSIHRFDCAGQDKLVLPGFTF